MANEQLSRIDRLINKFPTIPEEKFRLLLVAAAMKSPDCMVATRQKFQSYMDASADEMIESTEYSLRNRIARIEEFTAEPIDEDCILYEDFIVLDEDDDYDF